MKKTCAVAVLATGILVSALGGSSQAGELKLGVLQCDISAGLGLIVTQKQKMDCVYSPSNGKPADHYVGTLHQYGLEIGATSGGTMQWIIVSAQAKDVPPGALAGSYGGASANASVAVGVGANYLVGGNDNAFTLQPLSVQGQTGLNVAAGVSSMKLEYAPN